MRRRGVILLAAAFTLIVLGSLSALMGWDPKTFVFTLSFAVYAAAAAFRLRVMGKSAPGLAAHRPVRGYRPRQTDAGKWVDAPVAELDKSTVGLLLANRAGRDPGLNVVVRRSPPEVRSEALYDAELDG